MLLSHVAASRRRREQAQAIAMMDIIEENKGSTGQPSSEARECGGFCENLTEAQLRECEKERRAEALARMAARDAQRHTAMVTAPFRSHKRVSPHPPVGNAQRDPLYPIDGQARTRIHPPKTLGISRFRKPTYKYNGSDESRKRYYMEKDPDAIVDEYLDENNLSTRVLGPRVPSPPPPVKIANDLYGVLAEERNDPPLYAPNAHDTLPPYATSLALDRRERTDGTVRRAMKELRDAKDREKRRGMRDESGHKRRSSASAYVSLAARAQVSRRNGYDRRYAPYSDPVVPMETARTKKAPTSPISGTDVTSQPLPSIDDVFAEMRISRQ